MGTRMLATVESGVHQNFKDAIVAAGDDGTTLYSSQAVVTAAPTAAPSGALTAGTVACTGWQYLDLDVHVQNEAIEVTIRVFRHGNAGWSIATWAGFDGLITIPTGGRAYSIACGGADFIDVQLSSIGAGASGQLSASGTLSIGG